MPDLSDIIVGSRFAGASVSRIANLVGVSRVMTVYTNRERMFVCQTSAEAFHVDCLVPTVKHGGGSVMVWGAISSCELGHLVVLRGMITGDHYQSILVYHLHPIFRNVLRSKKTTPLCVCVCLFVYTSRCVQTWLHGHDDEVVHLTSIRSHLN
ncbi:transposable element Tcb1 transposase [Trichonephila clavipes]|nr:transposable element Tcb1 transposase [Trichonephila clavipes]